MNNNKMNNIEKESNCDDPVNCPVCSIQDMVAIGAGVDGDQINLIANQEAEIVFANLYDPNVEEKQKIVDWVNKVLTTARDIGLPSIGVASLFQAIVENKVDNMILGNALLMLHFWSLYSRFERFHETTRSQTGRKMKEFLQNGDINPYDVRNWLYHIGTVEQNKYTWEDVNAAITLLESWVKKGIFK